MHSFTVSLKWKQLWPRQPHVSGQTLIEGFKVCTALGNGICILYPRFLSSLTLNALSVTPLVFLIADRIVSPSAANKRINTKAPCESLRLGLGFDTCQPVINWLGSAQFQMQKTWERGNGAGGVAEGEGGGGGGAVCVRGVVRGDAFLAGSERVQYSTLRCCRGASWCARDR